jgi:hypothetical protein
MKPMSEINEIDRVMNLSADELTIKDKEFAIDYYRKLRASYEAGTKPAKKGEVVKVDLVKLGLIKAQPPMRR